MNILSVRTLSFTERQAQKVTYFGIDVHKGTSTVKWFCPAENKRGRKRIDTTPKAFAELLSSLPRPWIIAYEATRQAPALTKMLRNLDADELHLAHPRALREIGKLQKAKTDDKDAGLILTLLEVGMLPEAYLAPASVEDMREVSRGYKHLRQTSTKYLNALRHLFNKSGLSCDASKLLTHKGRQQVEKHLMELPPLGTIMGTIYWHLVQQLDEQCAALLELMDAQLKEHPAGAALLAIDGVGTVTAFGFLAEIGEPERFANCGRLHSYAGLVPKASQSDDRYSTGHLPQDCNKHLRYLAVCAANSAVRCKGESRAKNAYDLVKRGKDKRANVAKIAAARKILTDVLWAWRDAVK